MRHIAETYYQNLTECMNGVRVTLADERAIPFCEAVALACTWILELQETKRKIMFVGNGASAAISSHMAADFSKNVGMRAMAFNDSALLTAVANDYGYERVFQRPIETFADDGDMLFAISSSGTSPNISRAAQTAQNKKCRVITLTGFETNNPLSGMGDLNFYVPSPTYGCVEVVHHSICHCIIDTLVKASKTEASLSPKEPEVKKAAVDE
ncbi:MAG: SIS domain-containing protein [Phycisphaerae bacterium]|nr:SIS domain-containing protein [Phycisphaerae bacterium]